MGFFAPFPQHLLSVTGIEWIQLHSEASRSATPSASPQQRRLSSARHTGSAYLGSAALTLFQTSNRCAGTCPAPPRGRALCWSRPATRSVCRGWWRCKSPRRPASPPSSARSWSSGTLSTTPGPIYSSRWSTGDDEQCTEQLNTLIRVFYLV